MRWILVVAVVAGCKDKPTSTSAVPAPPRSDAAPPPADAAQSPADASRPQAAIDLGVIGNVDAIGLVGEHVYMVATNDDGRTYRRIARTGGTIESIATQPVGPGEPDALGLAALGTRIFVVGIAKDAARNSRAPLFEVTNGKAKVVATGPVGSVASTGLVAHEDSLYWVAATPMGPGAIMTTERTGKTRTVVACPDAAGEGCPELLPGSPPAFVDENGLTLLGAKSRTVTAPKCPACTIPSFMVGEHVACVMDPVSACNGVATFVHLETGAQVPSPLAEGVSKRAAGRYYAVDRGGLVRTSSLQADAELFAPRAQLFAVDELHVAWTEGDHLWIAPH